MCSGRRFWAVGPAYAKARSRNLECVHGMTKSVVADDQRPQRVVAVATVCMAYERYRVISA